ncbi:MAG: murein L,D-transpeptidase catalytic domain family protein [Bacteroidetes bacterium]|nr:murein L,D-transpeptidase catalytic domain family protein [Bacteroidota bacterium]
MFRLNSPTLNVRNFYGARFLGLLCLVFLFFCCAGISDGEAADYEDEMVHQQSKTKEKVQEAVAYCKEKGFNTNLCILIDMGVHSGKNRLMLWDLRSDSLLYSCLVSHGCGRHPWSADASKESPTFSNENGSHLSSLGKYKIGERGYSSWGVHVKYLLHGLEASNSRALARTIVFHSWDDIPEEEPYPAGTPEGWGCPAVSNASFHRIDPYLRQSGKPVLMWIYN